MTRREAKKIVYALGLTLYLDAAGRLNQFGPGERIDPPPGAVPLTHGHGRLPAAAVEAAP